MCLIYISFPRHLRLNCKRPFLASEGLSYFCQSKKPFFLSLTPFRNYRQHLPESIFDLRPWKTITLTRKMNFLTSTKFSLTRIFISLTLEMNSLTRGDISSVNGRPYPYPENDFLNPGNEFPYKGRPFPRQRKAIPLPRKSFP